MAHYEMYVCLNKATYESKVPTALESKLKYKVYDPNIPTSSNTVAEIKSWLTNKSIDFSGTTLKADLLEIVESAGPTEDYIPTWKEAAFNGKLGIPRESHDGAYIIVKGEFSMLTGEMTSIIALGASKAYPNNTVLTKTEAQTLVNSSTFTGE
tara:strand:+ start:87 stop:545 length:459 start_codon:yes stop_codon:yes gene_type:complete